MKVSIKFKSFGKFFEEDISNFEDDQMDEATCLNVNKTNYDYLKQTLTDKQLLELIKQNPSWLEFI